MKFTALARDSEDAEQSLAERAAAASRCWWVGAGIIGDLTDYPILNSIAALIVDLIIAKAGGSPAGALYELMRRAADEK